MKYKRGDRVVPSFEWLKSSYHRKHTDRKGTVKRAYIFDYMDGDTAPMYTVQWDGLSAPTGYVSECDIMLDNNVRAEASAQLQRGDISPSPLPA